MSPSIIHLDPDHLIRLKRLEEEICKKYEKKLYFTDLMIHLSCHLQINNDKKFYSIQSTKQILPMQAMVTPFIRKLSKESFMAILDLKTQISIIYPPFVCNSMIMLTESNAVQDSYYKELSIDKLVDMVNIESQSTVGLTIQDVKAITTEIEMSSVFKNLADVHRNDASIRPEFLFYMMENMWTRFKATKKLLKALMRMDCLSSRLVEDCIQYWMMFSVYGFIIDRMNACAVFIESLPPNKKVLSEDDQEKRAKKRMEKRKKNREKRNIQTCHQEDDITYIEYYEPPSARMKLKPTIFIDIQNMSRERLQLKSSLHDKIQ